MIDALTLRRVITVLCGSAAALLMTLWIHAAPAGADISDYGIESVSSSLSTSRAGAHPDFSAFIKVKTDPTSPPDADGDRAPYATTRNITIELPPGITGNPNSVASCSIPQFATALEAGGGCPADSQVGVAVLRLYQLSLPLYEPIYNLEAPGGDRVARLGFYGYVVPVIVDVKLRSESDYGLTTVAQNLYSGAPFVSASTEIWGVPAAGVHDTERITPKEIVDSGGTITSSPPRPSGLKPLAFLSNATSCRGDQQVNFAANSYQAPDSSSTASVTLPANTDCGSLEFDPGFSLRPTTEQSDSPSGLEAHLSLDQTNLSQPEGVAPANLKRVIVTLPEGLSVNPSAADGLGGCSEAEIGLISESPIRFNTAEPSCPESSKVGTVEIETPVLDGPISGSLYVASQDQNPFGSFLSGYLFAKGQGATIKLAGRFDLDSSTGEITATFDDNPQQPFSDLHLSFKAGSRGVLATPPQCGNYGVRTALAPWSALDPDNPAPSEILSQTSVFDITTAPNGGACLSPPAFTPSFTGGTVSPVAGSFSPLVARASRPDGSQVINAVQVELPRGLSGKLAGIPYCSDAALAAAADKTGAAERSTPSCPAVSRVGSVIAAVGAGTPFHVQGNAYLSGPYRGAPLSLSVITPAVAGPFDLGNVVVRAALQVNPVTAQVRAVSDALPTILRGIPLRVRHVTVTADKDEFALNPTSCDVKAIRATVLSPAASLDLSERFQVGGCRGLNFDPRLSLRLKGGVKRGSHPALRAVVTMRKGEANIAHASVALPRSEFLEQSHIRTVCTRVQFAADSCPRNSIYGYARAFTPLLDKPLEGPVYMRSSSNPLPDLVAALNGQIDIDVIGRIDSVRGGIRTVFNSVPDAPFSKFVLNMRGGKRGLLVNSIDLCAKVSRATVHFAGQNGKRADSTPVLANSCAKRTR
jgi:hypothetical protein